MVHGEIFKVEIYERNIFKELIVLKEISLVINFLRIVVQENHFTNNHFNYNKKLTSI